MSKSKKSVASKAVKAVKKIIHRSPNARKRDSQGRTNKGLVWTLWSQRHAKGLDTTLEDVKGHYGSRIHVADATVRTWISEFGRGYNFPMSEADCPLSPKMNDDQHNANDRGILNGQRVSPFVVEGKKIALNPACKVAKKAAKTA
jgi:hypothetical protein